MKTKPKSKINVRRLRAIQRQIAKEPAQFIMSRWFRKGVEFPNCGTAACISGWAVSLNQKANPLQTAIKLDPDFQREGALSSRLHCQMPRKAGRLLGLNRKQCQRLFFLTEWPCKFQFSDWRCAETRAELAIARIDHFIKTNGKE